MVNCDCCQWRVYRYGRMVRIGGDLVCPVCVARMALRSEDV